MIWNLNTAKKEHQHSPLLAKLLSEILPPQLVYDFGCGKGTYLKYLSEKGFDCVGFEGTPDISEIADFDSIIQLDLSKPIKRVMDKGSVICLEVAEHIPREFEETLLNNITSYCNGLLILSWAVKGQGGCGHVNEQDSAYVIKRLAEKGFTYNEELSNKLREAGKELWWFSKSIYVFIC